MSKGLKRICMNCGARFYDLDKSPIICPSCDTEFTGEIKVKSRRGRPPAEDKPVKAAAKPAVAEEADDEIEDIDADDDIVSLDDADEDNADDLDDDEDDNVNMPNELDDSFDDIDDEEDDVEDEDDEEETK